MTAWETLFPKNYLLCENFCNVFQSCGISSGDRSYLRFNWDTLRRFAGLLLTRLSTENLPYITPNCWLNWFAYPSGIWIKRKSLIQAFYLLLLVGKKRISQYRGLYCEVHHCQGRITFISILPHRSKQANLFPRKRAVVSLEEVTDHRPGKQEGTVSILCLVFKRRTGSRQGN